MFVLNNRITQKQPFYVVSSYRTIAGPLLWNKQPSLQIFHIIYLNLQYVKLRHWSFGRGDKSSVIFPRFRINVLILPYGRNRLLQTSLVVRDSKVLNGIFDLNSQKQKFANFLILFNFIFHIFLYLTKTLSGCTQELSTPWKDSSSWCIHSCSSWLIKLNQHAKCIIVPKPTIK